MLFAYGITLYNGYYLSGIEILFVDDEAGFFPDFAKKNQILGENERQQKSVIHATRQRFTLCRPVGKRIVNLKHNQEKEMANQIRRPFQKTSLQRE
jgi:hypothetical protein